MKANVIRRHTNTLKPFLTNENMVARLRFCLSMLEDHSIPNSPTFRSMHNIIHIDEKWFYMTKKKENYYLGASEEDPHRTCKNKNFITKVMFLVALARPRFDNEGNETFSGKIGVFPLVTYEHTKRRSINREADTLVTKPISSINKEVCRNFLCNLVLPAIKAKWPRDTIGESIIIQQDNATCHVNDNDEELRRAACESGFDIHVLSQPPNSPDLNVLDLGYFNAIQALQHKEAPKTIDDLISAVKKSYDNLSSFETNKIFLTIQATMVEVMKVGGSNKYKLPYWYKNVPQREGGLPSQLQCDASIVEAVLAHLREVDV
ncbi:hypothetical protein K1719_046393 [Acacia pycnantha]|nr:hypothetical protein K1719_046393 [Acacia pycnantha]